MVCKQRNKTSDGLHVIYRYLLTVNQAIGSQFENLVYNDIGDILLETLFACRVFGICMAFPEFWKPYIFPYKFPYIFFVWFFRSFRKQNFSPTCQYPIHI